MVRGAFARAIPAFLTGHAPLLYAHASRDVLGKVLEMSEDSIGVKMVARVNRQPESSPLRWIWEALRNKTIKGLSCGAVFHREARPDGTSDIVQADIVEASVTATPQLPSTSFEIVAEGKAFNLAAVGFAQSRAVRLRRAEHALEMLTLKIAAAEFANAVAEARLKPR